MTKDETIRVQIVLTNAGLYHGELDGIAGPATTGAIRIWQRRNGLLDDGLVGPKTWRAMFPQAEPTSAAPGAFYKGAAKSLEPGDVERVAQAIAVPVPNFKAVIKVESAGRGFDSQGRVLALYEPHIAFRMARGETLSDLIASGLAYERWGERPYPPSSYERIDACWTIAGAEIAADSSSWGYGQIMGFNAQAAGYMTAVAMVRAFAADAENQIAAMGAFIMNNAVMYRALQRGNWSAFAEAYNGKGYQRNGYDARLAAAARSFA